MNCNSSPITSRMPRRTIIRLYGRQPTFVLLVLLYLILVVQQQPSTCFSFGSVVKTGPRRRAFFPLSSYKGYPDAFDDSTKNNEDDDDMNWWDQAIKRASSSSSSSSSSTQGGGMVQPVGVDGEPLETPKDQSRIKAGFDKLFAGMPSVSDILSGSSTIESGSGDGGDDEDDGDGSSSTSTSKGRRSRRATKSPRDPDEESFSWFEEERSQIMDNYQDILDDTLEQLDEQRKLDPEKVPGNAEAMVKSVLKEEMEREIIETRERRARERLDEYEHQLREEEAVRDISGPPDASLQKLIDESEEEYAKNEESRAELDDFLRYEEEAFRRAVENTDAIKPSPGADLDRWALERLKAMAKAKEGSEAGLLVMDILEESVNDLQTRIQNQSKKGPIKPNTMKEWQMYRSIATRLLDSATVDYGNDREHDEEREQRILAQLDSWKDYIQKETSIRARSGLARGPKLPFEWQESTLAWDQRTTVPDKRSRAEVRKDINRMSIDAMESLIETSDPSRKDNLQREVDFLKSTLESRDYLDIEEDEIVDQPVSPVDLSGVFTRSDEGKEKEVRTTSSQTLSDPKDSGAALPNSPFFAGQATSKPSPPSSPFFSDPDTARSRPPDTPFFTDESEVINESVVDSKLGSMEEQKLNAMFRRTGVRSKEEQDVIRRQWDDFKRTEQEKRMESGLTSRDDGDDLQSFANLKYNISDVMLDDGDFDAEKVLATIGPRPKRSKQRTTESDLLQDPAAKSSVDEGDVRDSLYRAVSAIGGGRYKDDPESRARHQASFEDFLEKEEVMRQSLDDLRDAVVEMDINATFDDKGYAEAVLSSLGPRPKPKRTKIIDEGEYSDKGGVLASEDEDDESIDDDLDARGASEDLWSAMPEWLRKERARDRKRDSERSQGRFLGSDIDEVFDDDDYDHNTRQLHEYEQRRAGGKRQMGIDISDVIGKRAYETDDYADYKFDDDNFRSRASGGWGTASFSARKRDLLQYTELDLTELNRLMDHKDSVYATGVSQYLPRINRPFKEFGAIFRLEGVLVDTTGIQLKAWSKVAKDFQFRAPTVEEVRRAAVIRPESAVREAFYWTDDILECRKAAVAHRDALRKVFDEWRDLVGIAVPDPDPPSSDGGFLAIGQDVVEDNPQLTGSSLSNASDAVGSSSAAWSVIATAFGKPVPTEEEGWHAASLSAEEAVVAFGWTDGPASVLEIAEAYRKYIQSGALPHEQNSTIVSDGPHSQLLPRNATGPVIDDVAIAETQYFAWKKVAERFQYEAPTPEATMAAFVINDPELVIREGFGWTDDSEAIQEASRFFKICFDELLRERMGGKVPTSDPQPTRGSLSAKPAAAGSSKPQGPALDELLDVLMKAWSTAARAHGLPIPTADIAKLTQGVDPEDAIRRLLKWSDDPEFIPKVADTYKRSYDEMMIPLMRRYGLKFEATASSTSPTSSSQTGPTDDDVFRLAVDAWSAVASKNDFPAPDNDQVMFAMTVGPEEAIVTGFQWTDDRDAAKTLFEEYKTEVGIRRQRWSVGLASTTSTTSKTSEESIPPVTVSPDVTTWVKSLLDVEMQCAVVSFLERDQLDVLLEYSGLSGPFGRDRRVSATDGYSRESQQLLGAALRLERRPDHCVVFDSSPQASDAAHENEMQSVNIVGAFPRYELLAADSTAGSFAELTAMNVRRLFGERIYDQPQLETQAVAPVIQRQTKIQTRFWDDE